MPTPAIAVVEYVLIIFLYRIVLTSDLAIRVALSEDRRLDQRHPVLERQANTFRSIKGGSQGVTCNTTATIRDAPIPESAPVQTSVHLPES